MEMDEPDLWPIAVSVNGVERSLAVAADETLLDVLRDRLGLTGTKRGCDRGACGTCTVLSDGRAINACLLLAPMADGARIVTIEGLGTDGRLHALQQAFVEHDALQCGFCTPGQILAAIGLLDRRPTTDELRDLMSGNLCRCGAYPNIIAAIESVMAAPR
jgi:xanthine dehydrogenase YagT iron-sulfur-binding subunit